MSAGPYRRPVSTFWWLRRRSYFVFVLRELSSVFVAWFVVFLLLLVHALGSGRYQQFLALSASGWMLALNVIALLFLLLHAVTWFGLAPQALVIRIRGRRVPQPWVLAAHYALWVVLSAIVIWVILGG
ncbi:hypothetical protein MOQ72_41705 [Saccharopolyspora sp. K220]|uniref:hypothetical protein n=1 Tax=Saccharopolyspora soli TaxID=2926618 RepID=UPI001F5617F2|nr:hypothetical protein [Saccharopolyspora soli]MCI2423935.1 hypothetical protein [Saccharopolyspora soli]